MNIDRRSSLLREPQRRAMAVNRLPLACLFDQHHCTPVSGWLGGAIRLGGRPHRVACNDGDVSVDLHLGMAELHIELDTSIKLGLEIVPFVFKRIGSVKELARPAKTAPVWRVELHVGVRIAGGACSVMVIQRRLHIIRIITQGDSRQEHAHYG